MDGLRQEMLSKMGPGRNYLERVKAILVVIMKMNSIDVKERHEKGDYSEAAHVGEEYEYLLKNKDQGITFEEYCSRRGINL